MAAPNANKLDLFCNDEFLDLEKTLRAPFPELSQCFQHTVLVWVPCAFLFIFSPLLIYRSRQNILERKAPLRWTGLLYTKMVVQSMLVVLTLIEIVMQSVRKASNGPQVGDVWWVYPLIQCITMSFVLYLFVSNQRGGVVTSGVLFLNWILFIIAGFPELLWWCEKFNEEGQIKSVKVTFFIYYALILVQFFLSFFADRQTDYYEDETEKPMPEFHSSFPSQLSFWWLNTMTIKGHKRPLETADLYTLNDRDLCQNLVPQFDAIWSRKMKDYYTKKAKVLEQQARLQRERRDADEDTPLLGESKKDSGPKMPGAPSILGTLFECYRPTWLSAMAMKIIYDLMQFISPQIQKVLLTFIQDPLSPTWLGVFYALLIFASAFVQSMILHQYYQRMFFVGMDIKAVLTATVFGKSLRLSNAARKDKTVGEIVNLIAVDAERFQTLTTFAMQFISAPILVVVSLYFLWDLLGPAVLGGFAVLVITIPVNFALSHKMRQYQMDQMKYKDDRIKMMNEILGGMKVLKLYAWEPSMAERVLEVRAKEVQEIKKIFYLDAAMIFSWSIAPFLVTCISFAVYVISDPENNKLTPEVTFVALSLFNILRIPMSLFGNMIARAVQVWVSNKRMREYLCSEDLDPTTIQRLPKGPGPALRIARGTFGWDKTSTPNLSDIDISIEAGKLIAVVGKVGSGKTSLVAAMLGEMDKLSGSVTVRGSVSYVPQQAWIQNMTVRDNITFGKAYNNKFYDKILKASCLKADLLTLPGGDSTEIGEKGINLSGGQKQRVSLARALYQERDIYLLDDVLSAVDSHVGKDIFNNVIGPKGILDGKTRVLVTHGLTYLKDVDTILVVKDGRISERGTYDELMQSKGAFAEFLEEHLMQEAMKEQEESEEEEPQDHKAEVEDILEELGKYDPPARTRLQSQLSGISSGGESDTASSQGTRKRRSSRPKSGRYSRQLSQMSEGEARQAAMKHRSGSTVRDRLITGTTIPDEEETDKSKLIEDETTETGRVKSLVYWSYIQAIGLLLTISFFLLYFVCTGFDVGSNLWLAAWSDQQALPPEALNETKVISTTVRLTVYAILGIGHAGFIFLSGIVLAVGMVLAGIRLHKALLDNIMRSPMSFFDVTPTGRILNRFSKDVDSVDIIIPLMMTELVSCIFEVLAALFVVLLSLPIFGVVVIPMAILYTLILRFYVSTSRQLKRMESVSRSPIYSHLQETINGAISIRAYNVVDRFEQECQKRVDFNNKNFYPNIIANRWLGVRLEFIGNCIVLFVALFAVLFRNSTTAGLAGLSITYSLNITFALNVAVRILSELETNIVSVERMREYSISPTEADWESEEGKKPPQEWPDEGVVKMEDYATRYREGMELVLRGIDAHIAPSEKVGIVGRTGAGKSSLTLSLFRIIEAAEGKIVIDGRDIADMGLHDLRSKLTIIPQEPVLFSGSLRMNLDPFNKYSDEQIWKALEHSFLKDFVSERPEKLQYTINEGGENLSVGQRQLLCLGRALLRKTKVLILDEATAAIDLETDAMIQKTIREQFADCTILTIAHRLNTILDSDRVIVLDQGRIKEFESPQKLLADPESEFYSMAKDANIVA